MAKIIDFNRGHAPITKETQTAFGAACKIVAVEICFKGAFDSAVDTITCLHLNGKITEAEHIKLTNALSRMRQAYHEMKDV